MTKPYDDNRGQTHYPDCYRDRGHHNCAVDKVDQLRRGIDATLATVVSKEQEIMDLRREFDAVLVERDELRKYVEEAGEAIHTLMTDNDSLRAERYNLVAKVLEEAAVVAEGVKHPPSIGKDKGRHHEAGAQHAAKLIRAKIKEEPT